VLIIIITMIITCSFTCQVPTSLSLNTLSIEVSTRISSIIQNQTRAFNHAGRLVYINSVLASIPMYYMSTILFFEEFIDRINMIIRKFWWSRVKKDNSSTSFSFRSWKDICRPKAEGGLGIRDLQIVNRSLIVHAAWNIATGKNPYLTSILKSKYFANTSFWLASSTPIKSAFWSSILQVKKILVDNCIIQIHKGDSSIWSTPWCPIWNQIHDHIKLPVTDRMPVTISDLWNNNTHHWDFNFISQIFDSNATSQICSTQIVPSNKSDIITWKPATKGVCSAKEAFKFLNQQMQVSRPTQGARGITDEAMNILRRMWKHKMLPPNIKTFGWRLIRKAIATGARAGNLSSRISKQCDRCNDMENDAHLFFHCSFARAVWFSSNTPIYTSMLPIEQDGVQEILAGIITSNTSEQQMQRIMTTLWYL